MQKRLVRVGNSLALVIDSTLLRVLKLTRMSKLSVTMEGGRIVITPLVGNGDPRPPSRREALRVVDELQKLGFRQAHLDRLAPEPIKLGKYVMRLDTPGKVTPAVEVTMCRMAELRRLLREGWSQRHAFAAAIAAHPHAQPTGIETRIGDDESRGDAANDAATDAANDAASETIRDVVVAEMELARREARFAEQEREDQRLAQEARNRCA